jgi:hypothetical protein
MDLHHMGPLEFLYQFYQSVMVCEEDDLEASR